MTSQTNRRSFLKASAVVSAATFIPAGHVLGDEGTSTQTKEKLNMAIIGAGGRGRANMSGVSGENIYALCDTNRAVLEKAKAAHPNAKTTTDWRDLVDDPKVDAVVISTADHHHALAGIAALRNDKHVYCEKPLAHTVHEARIMQDEYIKRRDKIATQMGTQIHAGDNFRRTVELIQAGAIGKVREAHVWCSRSIRPVDVAELPAEETPANFDWDVWLGPAAERPYNAGYWKGGNLNWNRRWEFGNGVLGDMGSHLIDLAFWALDLKRPLTVEAQGPEPDDIACPPWQEIVWEHAARESSENLNVPVKVFWYHGGEGMQRRSDKLQPLVGDDTVINKWGIGVGFVGDKGTLVSDYGKRVLSPSAKFKDYPTPEQKIAKSLGHYNEWIAAAKGGQESLCNFDYSGALIEHNLLGNVAFRVGKKLEWDANEMQATNAPEAAAYLTKTYRDGWGV
jgi:predicted dehydrogenase